MAVPGRRVQDEAVAPFVEQGVVMRSSRDHRTSTILSIVAAGAFVLMGCGVSGKTDDNAAPDLGSRPKVTTPKTEPTTSEPDPSTTDTTDTTEPDTSTTDTSDPGTSLPIDPGDLRKTYLGILKRSGLTDKEAKCVVKLVFKNDSQTIDPNSTDFTKLGAKYLDCLGPDGAPGGSD